MRASDVISDETITLKQKKSPKVSLTVISVLTQRKKTGCNVTRHCLGGLKPIFQADAILTAHSDT